MRVGVEYRRVVWDVEVERSRLWVAGRGRREGGAGAGREGWGKRVRPDGERETVGGRGGGGGGGGGGRGSAVG